jgi:phage gpG-like protein
VALSSKGDTALIGGPGDAGKVGAAWVFTLSGETWSQQGTKLTGTDESGTGEFGQSVALSKDGTTALIGAPGDSSKAGAAWVFTSSSEGAWSQRGEKLTGSGESGAGELGRSVALSSEGNTALVGGPADNTNSGAAWVFARSEAAAWNQQGEKLTGSGETGEGSFGSSVALSSDGIVALVGGPADNTNIGAAWLFARSEAGAWALQGGKLTGSGEEGEGQFGGSVVLSSDGNTALVGGPAENSNIGAAWAFANPPSVGSVSPDEGPQAGGTSVTITGTNFNEATVVEFGSGGATSFEVTSASTITAVAPVGSGTVDVSVTTSGGTSATSAADKFDYVPVPTVVTEAASSITQTTATLNATVSPNGGQLSNCNFEYGTTGLYEFSVPCASLPGSGTEPAAVSAALEDLSANTTYEFRIVATNPGGTSIDILNAQTFNTLPNAPTVVTEAASSLAQTTATLGATVNPNGGEVTSCELDYGTSETYGESVPCASLLGSGSSPVAVSAAVVGLSADTTYHFRIVAINSGGTSTGSDQTFQTLPNPPTAATETASSIAQTAASLSATVNPNGGSVSDCKLEYGTSTSYGSSTTCAPSPGSGSSAVAVSAAVTGLSANTTYHFRVVATNAGGTGTGSDGTFRTLPNPPTVVTVSGSPVTQTTATLNATVNPNGGETGKCYFEYGEKISYGHKAPCTASPGAGASPVAVSASVTGLIKDTTYHFRIVAANAGGTSPGPDQTFETAPGPPTVIAGEPSAIGQTSAVLNAEINPNGGVVTQCYFHYERLTSKPEVVITPCVGLPLSGKSPVKVSALAEGLSASTRYSFSLEVINSFGEDAFGEGGMPFETLPGPEVVTGPASLVTQTSATLNATVNPNGGEVSSCEFEYGTSEAGESESIPCESQPGAGKAKVPVSAKLQGLSANTKYFFRIVATNPGGTSKDTRGQTFATLPNAPAVVTGEESSVTQTSASINATVNENGGPSSDCDFEYGSTTSYGSSVPCTPSPGSGTGPVLVSAVLASLTPNATYHVRIVAANPGGTSAGGDETFTTLPDAPAVLTAGVSSVAQTSATLRATVNPNGGRVSACQFEYGASASYGSSVPCSALPGAGTSPVAVSAPLVSLSANATYHFRVVATNPGGASLGADQAFTTEAVAAMTEMTTTATPSVAMTATPSTTLNTPDANCRASLASGTVAVGGDGMAAVKLSWTGTGTSMCSGKLMLRARVKARNERPKTMLIGTGSFSLPAGRVRIVTLKIDGIGRALFSAAHGRLSASLAILKLSPGPSEAQTEAVLLARGAHSSSKRG